MMLICCVSSPDAHIQEIESRLRRLKKAHIKTRKRLLLSKLMRRADRDALTERLCVLANQKAYLKETLRKYNNT